MCRGSDEANQLGSAATAGYDMIPVEVLLR